MRGLGGCSLLLTLILALWAVPVLAMPKPAEPAPSPATAARDGSNDFDFELGTWKIHLKKLLHPLTGSKE